MDPRSSLGIGPRFERCGENSSGVHYDFAEGIGKIARNTTGDRRRKTMRLTVGNAGSCRITGVDQRIGQHVVQVGIGKVKGIIFPRFPTVKPPVSGGCTAVAQVFERLTTVELPKTDG
ncbi:hypothetical protein BHM03_00048222 [Ensete ventricosum]|nr:hypothetical protein BHM03_00048222 [Ensete ventricosum]